MKKIVLFASLSICSGLSFGQNIMADENFDSYTVNQTVATQSPYFTCVGGAAGGSTDALVSNAASFSPTNSMRITNNKDMLYSFSNQTAGRYAVLFKANFASQGYINVQHVTQSNWAFDLYFNSSNQIMYLNENNPANAVNIGSYTNNTWLDFVIVIDIDMDSVWVYIDGMLSHNAVFHKSTQAGFSTQLAAVNFYGLSQFNGVINSDFYIDNFMILDYNDTESLTELTEDKIALYPNPANSATTVSSEVAIKELVVSDLNGRICSKSQFDSPVYFTKIESLQPGSYLVSIHHELGTSTKILLVE